MFPTVLEQYHEFIAHAAIRASMSTKHTGDVGETIAAEYLREKKYTVVEKNYRVKLGELDIIARDSRGVFVFIEVKTLSVPEKNFKEEERMFPEYHFTAQKLRKLTRLAELYIAKEKPFIPNGWRIDLIAIDYDDALDKHALRHFENVGYR